MSEEIKSFTKEEILAVMPQQPPFLFLDSAEISENCANARYEIKGDEFFLKGHFKNNPVFPGTIMFEAMGQLAVFYLLKSESPAIEKKVDPGKIFFTSSDGARCARICRPGDVLEISVKPSRIRYPIGIFSGSMSVNGERAAFIEKISLTFGYMEI